MIHILDIQPNMDYLVDDSGKEYDFIIVTATIDDDEVYNDLWFAKKSDEADAIENGLDVDFYAYLPDECFETPIRGTLDRYAIRSVWDTIEKRF